MKKIIFLVSFLVLAFAFSTTAFAAEDDTQAAVESALTQTYTTAAVAAANDDMTTKADKKAFKGQLADKFTQLEALRAVCKSNWEKLKGLNTSIKSTWADVKAALKAGDKEEAKQTVAEIKSKIEPVRAQIKTIHSGITSLRDQKKTEWTNFRAAVKERDLAKATTAINNILVLKQQIIDKQNALIPLKENILGILNSYK